MSNRRGSVQEAQPRYPNQWRQLRRLRGYDQRQVARQLGHFDEKYYQRVEAGQRFPGPRILFILLTMMGAELRQAYPTFAAEAIYSIDNESPSGSFVE